MTYVSREARLMVALKHFLVNRDEDGVEFAAARQHSLGIAQSLISAVMPPVLAPLAASIQPATARDEDGRVSFAPLVHLIRQLTFEESCVLDLLELGHNVITEITERGGSLCRGVKVGRVYEAEIVTTAPITTQGVSIPPRHILTLSIEPRWIER